MKAAINRQVIATWITPEEAPQGALEEVAKEVVETPPKRRGRPRKTTVDDLIKNAKASDNS